MDGQTVVDVLSLTVSEKKEKLQESSLQLSWADPAQSIFVPDLGACPRASVNVGFLFKIAERIILWCKLEQGPVF